MGDATAARFLGLFDTLTRADLDQLDAEIEAREDELDKLHAARALLVTTLGERNQKGLQAKRDAGSPGQSRRLPATVTRTDRHGGRRPGRPPVVLDGRRKAVAAHILRHGPGTAADLGRACGIPPGTLPKVFQHEWFAGAGGRGAKIDLTPAGRAAARGDGPGD